MVPWQSPRRIARRWKDRTHSRRINRTDCVVDDAPLGPLREAQLSAPRTGSPACVPFARSRSAGRSSAARLAVERWRVHLRAAGARPRARGKRSRCTPKGDARPGANTRMARERRSRRVRRTAVSGGQASCRRAGAPPTRGRSTAPGFRPSNIGRQATRSTVPACSGRRLRPGLAAPPIARAARAACRRAAPRRDPRGRGRLAPAAVDGAREAPRPATGGPTDARGGT
jgi:hypothetical protein